MSTLGLSGSRDESEGVLKSLFWPSVRNAYDADLMASRGFWLCCLIGLLFALLLVRHQPVSALLYGLFFLLGAMGVRQGSLAAATGVFVIYLLETIFAATVSVGNIGFLRLVCLGILLANLRAAYLAHRWKSQSDNHEALDLMPERMRETWRDKLVDQLPLYIWPWGRAVFYFLFSVLLCLDLIGYWVAVTHRLLH